MTVGIYCIVNNINGKRYIGQSCNIEMRYKRHIYSLNLAVRDKKSTDRFLFEDAKIYGVCNFSLEILEEHIKYDRCVLIEREAHFMSVYNTRDIAFGYNLRCDGGSYEFAHETTRNLISIQNTGENNPNFGNKWTDEMKKNMSSIKKDQFSNGIYDFMKSPEYRKKISEFTSNMWKDKEKKLAMASKVSAAKSTLMFYQYDKNSGELVNIWESMSGIIKSNPNYHDKSIYSVCNGHKKSYRGYIWKSKLKERNEA